MDKRYDFDLQTVANDWKDMVGKDWQIYKLKPVYSTSFVPVFYVDDTEPLAVELVRRWNHHEELVETLRETMRVLVTPGGLPDKKNGRTMVQQDALDRVNKLLSALNQ